MTLPAYQVKDAARYAGVTTQTILNWQKKRGSQISALSARDKGKSLSYLQLIELAVVAAMRSAGVSLEAIRDTRDYVAQRLKSEFPFAEYKFKTDGKNLLMELSEFDSSESTDKLIMTNQSGQLGGKTARV